MISKLDYSTLVSKNKSFCHRVYYSPLNAIYKFANGDSFIGIAIIFFF